MEREPANKGKRFPAKVTTSRYYQVILSLLKTAISIPDGVFSRVEKAARRLGISRSEFFAKAAERWVDELDQDQITDQLNAVLDSATDDENSRFLRAAAAKSLPEVETG
ncbi:MAG: CopG family transcriptional regulator [Actinomycetota bacterium]